MNYNVLTVYKTLCLFSNHQLKANRAVKLLQQIRANLNCGCDLLFYAPCIILVFCVVFCNNTTKLTTEEINRMSPMIAAEWNRLAALMNIPYYQQEDIRFNQTLYTTLSSKAEQIFMLFNLSEFFSRAALKKHFKELGRHDVECQMLPFENEVFCDFILV